MSRYLLQSVSKAQTKRGKAYLRMTMYEPGGRLWPAILWEDKDVKSGQIVDALVEESSYNGTPQLEVKAMRVIAEKAENDEFLPRAKVDTGVLKAELEVWINSVVDGHIKSILKLATDDPRWTRAPAAAQKHHAYLGGLMVHTVGLCRLADAIAKLYPALCRDYLIFGAVMHDLGKLDELEYESNIEYSNEGKLLGHIVIGYTRLQTWGSNLKVPEDKLMLLSHLLLAHHGNKAYGSPISPQTPEAVAFSAMDGIDATLASVFAAADKVGDNEWTERISTGECMYLAKPK